MKRWAISLGLSAILALLLGGAYFRHRAAGGRADRLGGTSSERRPPSHGPASAPETREIESKRSIPPETLDESLGEKESTKEERFAHIFAECDTVIRRQRDAAGDVYDFLWHRKANEEVLESLIDEGFSIRKAMRQERDRCINDGGVLFGSSVFHDQVRTIMAQTDATVLPLLEPALRARYLERRNYYHEQICKVP